MAIFIAITPRVFLLSPPSSYYVENHEKICCQVFPPSFRDLPPTALELFDLEEAFSSERAQLSQLANKCLIRGGGRVSGCAALEDEIADLEYWVREAGRIVSLANETDEAVRILNAVVLLVTEFKKNNVYKDDKSV